MKYVIIDNWLLRWVMKFHNSQPRNQGKNSTIYINQSEVNVYVPHTINVHSESVKMTDFQILLCDSQKMIYRKFPKYSDTQKICCNHSKIWTMCAALPYSNESKRCGRNGKQCRPLSDCSSDQTAPLGAVWSGSAFFAQAYLSENLGSLRYRSKLLALF